MTDPLANYIEENQRLTLENDRLKRERDEAVRLLKVCAELIQELPKGPIASVIADLGLHGLRESITRLEKT